MNYGVLWIMGLLVLVLIQDWRRSKGKIVVRSRRRKWWEKGLY